MKIFSQYFDRELSFANFKNRFDSLTKVVFLPNYEALLISYGGHSSRLIFDKQNGGDCTEIMTDNFIEKNDLLMSKIN